MALEESRSETSHGASVTALRNPHHVRHLVMVALERHGMPCDEAGAGDLLASLLDAGDWSRLLDAWGTPAMPMDDLHMSAGAVAARRSRQLERLRAAGLVLADALEVIYQVHPTSSLPPLAVSEHEVDRAGFAIRDGFFARMIARGGSFVVDGGLGCRGADGRLVVHAVTMEADGGESRSSAAAAAVSMLRMQVEEARGRFLERRSYYRLPRDGLFETMSGSMDTVEVISPILVRAFMSDSSETGCYVLDRHAAEGLPAFAVYERHRDGRVFLDADGMGLILPMIRSELFTEEERRRAARRLADERPLTYAVLAGGIVDRANFPALLMEWDDEAEPDDLPEFVTVQRMEAADGGRSVIVMAVRTDDLLQRRDVAEGHLFKMSSAEFARDVPIDPKRHLKIEAPGVAIALVRPPA